MSRFSGACVDGPLFGQNRSCAASVMMVAPPMPHLSLGDDQADAFMRVVEYRWRGPKDNDPQAQGGFWSMSGHPIPGDTPEPMGYPNVSEFMLPYGSDELPPMSMRYHPGQKAALRQGRLPPMRRLGR